MKYLLSAFKNMKLPMFKGQILAEEWRRQITNQFNSNQICPDWCGSAGWASSCELRGRQFNTQSEPMPRLQARPLARSIREATNPLEVPLKHPCLSPSLSLSLPLSLKINKIFKKICFIFKEIVIRYCVVLYMSTQHQNQHHIQFRILPFLAEKRETSLSTSIKTSLITYRKEWNPFQNASVRIKCTNIC